MKTRHERITNKMGSLAYCAEHWAEALADEDHHSAWSYVEDMERSAGHARVLTVEAMRAAGRSWEDIGEIIGMTRQAAWERYRHRISADVTPPTEVVEDDGTTTVS